MIQQVMAYKSSKGRLYKTLKGAAMDDAKWQLIEKEAVRIREEEPENVKEIGCAYDYLHSKEDYYRGETLIWLKYPQIEGYHWLKEALAKEIIKDFGNESANRS